MCSLQRAPIVLPVSCVLKIDTICTFDNNFSFLKIRVANSGNILGLLSKDRNSNNKKTFLNIPLAQYFKADIEYKKFWDTGNNSVFAFRTLIGAIITYDNSDIPFIKSYFAGGSNDIRAWQTYDLGPGSRNSGLEYNIGSLKFLTSAEYRFDLFGSLKGALFVDAGNIWDITNSIFAEEEATFNGINNFIIIPSNEELDNCLNNDHTISILFIAEQQILRLYQSTFTILD